MKKIGYFLLLTFLLLFTKVHSQCLTGIYTIGGVNPNYATFSSAVSALISNGVCGPVIFQARNGIYPEQFSIPSITGASAVNTITFEAENSSSPNVSIEFPTSTTSTANYVVQLNNCSYITFHNLKLKRTGSFSYSRVVALVNNCGYDRFLNNNLQTVVGNNTPDYFSVVWCDTTNNSHLLFDGNIFTGGSYGIDLVGPTLTPAQGNVIQFNTFSNQAAYYVYAGNQDAINLTGNISSQTVVYAGMIGLMLNHCLNGIVIDRNRIYLNGNSIHLYDCSSNASARIQVTNNFVTSNSGTGITIYTDSYVDVINNSCSMQSTTQGTGIYVEASNNVRVLNNCVSSGLHTLHIYTPSSITACDYNDLYLQSATGLGWGAATFYSSLASWRTNTGNDMNSTNVLPGFASTSNNLHITSNLSLEGHGTYVPTVTHDIDNQTRNNPPDIGADEFFTAADDAQLLGTQISFPICPGSNVVNARFKNIGTSPISSLMLGWKVNNITQPPVSFNGSILSGDTSVYITLGNYNFIADQVYNVKIWCYSPNGNTDPTPSNDTITFTNGLTRMNGVYAIGGLSSNYASFGAAVTALNTRGVCGPVTFNVWDGTYVEQVYLTHVNGTSPINRITFQSANLDSTLVRIQYAASTSSFQNYIIMFDGADYFTFRKMTIRRVDYPLGDYGMVIDMYNSAVGNILENNCIQGEAYNSVWYPNSGESVIRSSNLSTLKNDSNTIQNNLILYGTYGLLITRATSASILPENGWVVKNNQFIGQTELGINAINQNNILITGNTINTVRDTVSGSTFYGIYLYKCYNGVRVTYNNISHKTGWGIYVASSPGTLAAPGLVYNNTVSNKEIGLYITGTTYYKFLHNSINVRGPASTSYVYYQAGSSSITLWNNIFVHSNGGKIFTVTPATNLISNHNDFYTTGVFSNSYATLAAWRTTLHDTNSVFIQPGFISATDLHIPFNDTLNNRGDSIGIPDDLDHVHRFASKPDLGADEFDSSGVYDIGISHFVSPNGTNCHGMPYVIVSVKNYDSVPIDTVKTFTLYLRINSSMIDTVSWTGVLLPGDTVSVTATPSYYFIYGQNYQLTAWTSLPNNSVDRVPQNDTLNLNTGQVSMGGVYTIGGINPDFHTFNAAKNALVSLGVCDSVIFNVRTGLYQEQVVFPAISGAAYQRSVTLRSQNLDSSSVVLSYTTATTVNDFILYLNGADYFRFCYMTIGQHTNPGSEFSPIINIRNGATNNEFHNNVFLGRNNSNYSSQTPQYATIAIAGNGNHHQRIERNRFVNGIYEVLCDSVTTGNTVRNIIVRDNIFYNPHVCLFSMGQVDTLTLENNIMKSQPSSGTTLIALDKCQGSIRISRNQLYFAQTGITLSNCNGTPTDPILVSNNFYSCTNYAGGHLYGINIDSSNYVNILHNSIALEPPQPYYGNGDLFAAIMLRRGSNVNVLNNNIANYTSWLAIFTARTNILSSCDHNNYYTLNGRVANYPANSTYPAAGDTLHLNAWQALTGFDQNSTCIDPHFFYRDVNYLGAMPDLHLDPYNIVPLTSSLYFPLVSADIDNEIRNITQPTIGADEFIPASNDASLTGMLPGSSICAGTVPISVHIRNIGAQPLTTLTIAWNVNNIAQLSYNWTGSLNFGDSAVITIGTYNFSLGSSTVTVISQSPNGNTDPTPLGDTLRRVVSASTAPLPNLGPDLQICPNTTTSLNPGTFSNYLWSTGASTTTITVGAGTFSVIVSNVAGCSNSDTINVTYAPAPVISATGNLSVCNGSSTSITASGANSYQWQPGNYSGTTVLLNPASTTTYTITGTASNGCTSTYTFTITVIPSPVISISGSTSICIGSSTTLTANGALTYTWMPGNLSGTSVTLSPTANTTYTITGIASSGCSGTVTQSVVVHPLPTITANGSTTICAGTSTVLNSSGGGNFVWMPGNLTGSAVVVSPAVTTTYTVTGSSSFGCTNSATCTVTVNPLPTIAITASDTSICFNTSTTISAAGANSYIWNPGNQPGANLTITPLTTTTYTVTGTAMSGCTNTDTMTIIVNPAPSVSYIQSPTVVCINWNTITLSAGSPSGGIYSGPGVTGTLFDPSVAGAGTWNIVYTFTDTNNCFSSASQQITVDLCTGFSNTDPDGIIIYPNPFNNKLSVQVNESSVMTLYNSLGQLTGTWKLIAGTNEIIISDLPSGIYLVKIGNNNISMEKKLVKIN